MRPIRLELQAFGPYKDLQKVDFSKLSGNGIFLIKGPTGSGKTTIFDAMMFALYGGSSGTDSKSKSGRNDLEEWRFSGAEPKQETFVAFTFSAKGKTYRFMRKLTPKIKNFTESCDASVLDEAGNWQPLFENPKKADLNEKAEELVGLNKDQFRQVILLPQGQFERFLTANSAEKEEILKQIFDAGRWENYAQAFYSKAFERKSGLDEEKREIDARLKEDHLEDLGALSGQIEVRKKAKAANERRHQEYLALNLQKKLDEDRTLAERFLALHKLEKAKKDLEAQRSEIERKQKTADAAERAEKLRPLLEEQERAEKETVKRTSALNELQKELPKARESVVSAEQAKKEAEAQQSVYDNMQKRVGELESKRATYAAIGELRKKCTEAEKRHSAAVEAKRSADKVYESAVERAMLGLSEMKEAESKASTIRDSYFAGIYGELAAALEAEKPCPVCGSIHHPAPAQKSPDSVSKKQVEQAEATAKSAREKWNHAEQQRQKAEREKNKAAEEEKTADSEYTAIRSDLKNAEAGLVDGINDITALNQTIADRNNKMNGFNEKKATLQRTLNQANGSLASLIASISSAEKEKTAADEAYKAAEDTLQKSLSERGYPDADSVRKALLSAEERKAMQEEITAYKTNCENTEQALKESCKELENFAEPDSSEFEARQKEITDETKNYAQTDVSHGKEIERLTQKQQDLAVLSGHYNREIGQAESDLAFAQKLKGVTGIGLNRYVLGIMFGRVIEEANAMLLKVHSGRYQLYRTDDKGSGMKRGLELNVRDSWSPEKEGRSVSLLSGGEKFLVSLALSIGMSHVARNSGVETGALFIDEGFGTLDENSISDAMDVLQSVRAGNSMIGIISHVRLLEETIPTQLEVTKREGNVGNQIQIC